jgi:tetratricopeptide (TPR) repeat protein
MTSKVLFVKQETNWLALIPKLAVIGILCLCFYPIDKTGFFLIAFLAYYMLTLLAKFLFFPNALYEGVNLIKQAKFQEAIPFLQDTINYYTKYSWIDKFRFILLISSAKRTIRESSICNLAYCYLQIGQIQKAKEIYQDVLRQYPENINAQNTLNTIHLISQEKLSN